VACALKLWNRATEQGLLEIVIDGFLKLSLLLC